ncbi:MAG TPA: glycosyltransferase family 2 protein [Candidatus Peribacteria bacterium]|nr:glycosyltransferase family 2 protein [Candidatus Peribacteria bacterium]
MRLSVVLPCLNEAGVIRTTVERTARWMRATNIAGEIIVVDDGSADSTPEILKTLRTEEPMLRTVRQETTQGYGAAVRAGCDAAIMDTVAFMDSDGQFDPADIGVLLEALGSADVVWAVRTRRADGVLRIVSQRLYQALVRAALGLHSPDLNSGLKAFHRRTWPQIRPNNADGALFHAELLQRTLAAGLTIRHVAVHHFPRTSGKPTGVHPRVIAKMFRELAAMRRASTESRGTR